MRISRSYIIGVIAVCLLAPCLLGGCATRFGYGHIALARDGRTVSDFLDNWLDYQVYYSGLYVNRPSGLMFDPRHDDRELKGKNWRPVTDRETLHEIVTWLERNDRYRPRLMRVVGPDHVVYGHIYTGWHHVVARAVDTHTMYVMDLPSPLPEYAKEPGF